MSSIKYVVWSDDYSVGVEVLDIQHKHLISVINELYNITNARNSNSSEVRHILTLLQQYAVEHFSKEEEIMKVCGYKELDYHAKSHDFFKQYAKQLVVMQGNIDGDLSIDILDFLKEWLIKHIRGLDRKYIPCVAGRDNS